MPGNQSDSPDPTQKGKVPAARRPPRPRRATRSAMIGSALLGGGLLIAARGSAVASVRHATPARHAGNAGATVRSAHLRRLGAVLVDSAGRTLYLFGPDDQRMVTCTATNGCARAWPPLLAGAKAPAPGPGAKRSLLGTVRAPGGARQVTYDHWPLYTFAGDSGPGQARGQGLDGFGGLWSAVTTAGEPATVTGQGAPAPAPGTSAPAPGTSGPAGPPTSGIPQGNGGDMDADNHDGPSDGDGNV